jgi:hypothetical protein
MMLKGVSVLRILLRKARQVYRDLQFERSLPPLAKRERKRDRGGLPIVDPGPESCIVSTLDWIRRAQDHSRTGDGGFARDFSLIKGCWASSYPETTGYIIPTLLECARKYNDADLRSRAMRALDWLVSIQMPGGGFQGGTVDQEPRVAATFNTGQILLGLAAGVAEFGDAYRPSLRAAAHWLAESLDDDGCWRRHPTPFAAPGEKAYEAHVAWSLFEADRVDPGHGFGAAGLRQVQWVLRQQRANGWFDKCCLGDPLRPLTHTLGYVLRGIIEAYRWSGGQIFLQSAERTADAMLNVVGRNGELPGRLDSKWRSASRWVCLTGNAQIAACYFLLNRFVGRPDFLDAGRRLNSCVRRTVCLDGTEEIRGGVKGSFPIDGAYCSYEYPNWAAKFFIDANLMELQEADHG